MKTSYVHCKTPYGRQLLGFSAKLVKIAKREKGNQMCDIAFTFCNKKDKQFSKAIARQELAEKPLFRVRVLDVPHMLAGARLYAEGYVDEWQKEVDNDPSRHEVSQFNYVLRRFV